MNVLQSPPKKSHKKKVPLPPTHAAAACCPRCGTPLKPGMHGRLTCPWFAACGRGHRPEFRATRPQRVPLAPGEHGLPRAARVARLRAKRQAPDLTSAMSSLGDTAEA